MNSKRSVLLPDLLATLLPPELLRLTPRLAVTGITSDSREVVPGTLFVAIQGSSGDGHEHVQSAIASGAVAVICERDLAPDVILNTPYWKIQDTRLALGLLSSEFEGHPTRKLKLVGITGTSGKTTTTYLCEAILNAAGEKVGVIGTVNFRFGSKIYPSTHTTPGAPELQRLLLEMVEDGCTAVVMEVSSHALKQHRVAGCAFDAVAFTNLSREHLDFHPDMEDYFCSKELLFTEVLEQSRRAGKDPAAIVNVDDSWGMRLAGSQRARSDRFFPCGNSRFESLKLSLEGIALGVRTGEQVVKIQSSLLGDFNASNLSVAIAVGQSLGIPLDQIQAGIQSIGVVPGRLEKVAHPSPGPTVLVDYAHKPDALEKVLQTLGELLKSSKKSKLITVFGCGGDRDRGKRPIMGQIAFENSDRVIVTSDNPRTENPQTIIEEILSGIQPESGELRSKLSVLVDRAEAITVAVTEAGEDDVVLIAGKGHEDYQIVLDPQPLDPKRTKKVPFDDRKIAAHALNLRHKS